MQKMKRTTIRLRATTYDKAMRWSQLKRISLAAVFDLLLANSKDDDIDKLLSW